MVIVVVLVCVYKLQPNAFSRYLELCDPIQYIIHVYMYTYTYSYTHTYMHVFVYTYVHVYNCISTSSLELPRNVL